MKKHLIIAAFLFIAVLAAATGIVCAIENQPSQTNFGSFAVAANETEQLIKAGDYAAAMRSAETLKIALSEYTPEHNTASYVWIIFAAVVVAMICSKAFIKERTDIGIMRALGFTVEGLRVQFALRFLLVALFGAVLGGIASLFFTTPLLVAILKMVGLTQIENGVTLAVFLIPAVLIALSFLLFSYIVSGKIKSVEVRELISE